MGMDLNTWLAAEKGRAAALAAHFDVTPAAVSQWKTNGVPVRLITEPEQYRDPTRMWHAWNVDRLYLGGVQIKHRAHQGLNHQKSVLLYDQNASTPGDQTLAIFGSSNWTSPSAAGQVEHNMFTSKPAITSWLIAQFERKDAFRFHWENIAVGLTIFAIGLFKKVVLADSLAPLANPAFDAAAGGGTVSAEAAWLAALAYTLQLYFDFSGYSDMAIGASRLIGVQLPLNFDSPYKAASAIDFWRRWHMTLSRFLRDYLYFPLGGNRLGPRRRMLNLMIVMLLGGLWHGAGWTFVIWGGLHGLYLVINHRWRARMGARRMPLVPARLLTFLAVLFAWVVFRAADLPSALRLWSAMLGQGTGQELGGAAIAWSSWLICLLALALAWFAPNTQQIMKTYRPGLGSETAEPAPITWRPSVLSVLIVGALLAAPVYFVVFTDRVSDFLYFQF